MGADEQHVLVSCAYENVANILCSFLGQQLLCEYDSSDATYIFLHEEAALVQVYSVE